VRINKHCNSCSYGDGDVVLQNVGGDVKLVTAVKIDVLAAPFPRHLIVMWHDFPHQPVPTLYLQFAP